MDDKGPKFGVRHMQTVLLFLNIVVLYISRLHVSVTIVAMMNAAKSNADFPEFHWSEGQKALILSSFYWGYTPTQIPSGFLVRRFGVKRNLFIATFVAAVLNLVLPFLVSWGGWQIFCVLRCAQGVFQGCLYPASQQHIANWSPPAERNFIGGLTSTGFGCGVAAAMLLSGLIAQSRFGWPGTFYLSAIFCFLWCALWFFFGANDCQTSKVISPAERTYISGSLEQSVEFGRKRHSIPWRAFFTSPPFWSILIVRVAYEFGHFTVQYELPSYMNAIFMVNIRENGLYSALLYTVSWLMKYVYIFLGTWLMRRNICSLTLLRKSFSTWAMWLPACILIVVSQLGPNMQNLVIVLFLVIVSSFSATVMGLSLTWIDIAPNFVAVLVTLSNTAANAAVMLGPLFVGWIVSDTKNPAQWKIVFITVGVVLFLGCLIFLIWGTAVEQPWNATKRTTLTAGSESNENAQRAEQGNLLATRSQ